MVPTKAARRRAVVARSSAASYVVLMLTFLVTRASLLLCRCQCGFSLAVVIGASIVRSLLVVFCRSRSVVFVLALAFATIAHFSFVVSAVRAPGVLLLVIELLLIVFGCCLSFHCDYARCRAPLLLTVLWFARF